MLVDLVVVNNWLVVDNYVVNFVKVDLKVFVFGIFMKGVGVGGCIECNFIVCFLSDLLQFGICVGLLFGGGGSGLVYCCDGICEVEFFGGWVINNIIVYCNDFGIDVNCFCVSFIVYNMLINMVGIDVWGEGVLVVVFGNLFEGKVCVRKGGIICFEMNEFGLMLDYFVDFDWFDF